MTSKRDKEDGKRARNFLESFNALSLTGRRKSDTNTTGKTDDAAESRAARHPQGHTFPGGFAPPPPPHLPSPSPQWSPRPNNAVGVPPPPPVLYPRMPVPRHTSLTMQHAIAGSLPPPGAVLATPPRVPAHRPQVAGPSHSPADFGVPTPVLRPGSDDSLTRPPGPPPPPSHRHPRTPQPPKLQPPQIYRRAQSEPLSPPPAPPSDVGKETRQCCGITAAGKRCRKQVKVSGAQAHTDGDIFCHVHANKVGEPSGFYDRKTGQTFIKFNDWIPEYLGQATQVALRSEMQKARASSDGEGYIYVFEILDPTDKKFIHLKVGRATNLNRRMDQWGKQCGSKEQILRGFWPGGMDKDGVPMKGLVMAGPKGPWCHRLERLVHIELADLVTSTPYLEDGYPNVVASKEVRKGGKKDVVKCADCNTVHQEIFSFEQVTEGRYRGKEWENIVKPVIEKWGGFVEAYL